MTISSFRIIFAAAGIAVSVAHAGHAQGVRAIRPLPGYTCMSLNLTEEQARDFNATPPVLQAPSPSAAKIGLASAVVIVADPVRTENGYMSMLMLDGRSGWIQASKLRPYRSPSNPPAHCVPSMMSNGRPGFAFPQ